MNEITVKRRSRQRRMQFRDKQSREILKDYLDAHPFNREYGAFIVKLANQWGVQMEQCIRDRRLLTTALVEECWQIVRKVNGKRATIAKRALAFRLLTKSWKFGDELKQLIVQ
jgi:hypothetical protein